MKVITSSADLTAFILEGLHRQFVEDANPLHVWWAYRFTRTTKSPVPEWVADYLEHCAEDLTAGAPPSRALRLATKGGHSKFRQLATASRDTGIFSYVDFCMQLQPDDVEPPMPPLLRGESHLDRICEHVAEETQRPTNGFSSKPMSTKTVRDIYYRLKR